MKIATFEKSKQLYLHWGLALLCLDRAWDYFWEKKTCCRSDICFVRCLPGQRRRGFSESKLTGVTFNFNSILSSQKQSLSDQINPSKSRFQTTLHDLALVSSACYIADFDLKNLAQFWVLSWARFISRSFLHWFLLVYKIDLIFLQEIGSKKLVGLKNFLNLW